MKKNNYQKRFSAFRILGLFILFTIIGMQHANAQYTSIPDVNFEQALINLAIDDFLDGHVLTSAIATVTSLDVNTKNISSLAGIQDFTSLEILNCSFNQLRSLNLDGLAVLANIDCSVNQLASLSMNGLTSLQNLYVNNNQLLSLDLSGLTSLLKVDAYTNQLASINVSGLTNLTDLNLGDNQFASLDMRSLAALRNFNCGNNQLLNLYVSGLTNLQYLYCYNNQLTTIDTSGLTALNSLQCTNNQLISLNASISSNLLYLDCSVNQLQSLRVSGLTYLLGLFCTYNQLTSLNLSGLTALQNLVCSSNPNLTCIRVSNPAAALANPNYIKDATASYSVNCGPSYTAIPDANFEKALIDLGIDDINFDGQVLTSAITGIYGLNIENRDIEDLTGIEGFTSLQGLYCDNNLLTSLDLSGLSNLKYLSCRSNQIYTLNLTGLTLLESIDCSSNLIGSLDLTGFSSLKDLNSSNNRLTTLNLDGLTSLQSLLCNNNLLENLNLNGLTSLQVLNCNNNRLDSLTITNCSNLQYLHCENNLLEGLNVSSLTNLNSLSCQNNRLASIDLSGLSNLLTINCSNNRLPNINLSGLNGLLYLYCINNQLTSLNLTGLTSLIGVGCSVNLITTISGLSNNIQALDCSFNRLPNLNLSGFTTLVNLFCNNNSLESLDISGCTNLSDMVCTNNPNLYCITVSNPTSTYANIGWNKAPNAGYSTTSSCFGPVTVNYCKGEIALPLSSNVNSPAGITLKWYTVATRGTASLIAPTPLTTIVGTRNYYASQVIGGIEGSRVTITVIVNALPTTPGVITGNTSQGVLVGTTNTATYSIAPVAGATSYFWTVPAGVNIVSGQDTTSLVVDFNGVAVTAGPRTIGNIAVQAVNAARCKSPLRQTTIVVEIPRAPSKLALSPPPSGTPKKDLTNISKYVGTTTSLTLTATTVANATSYDWELPEGVTRTDAVGINSTLPTITVNFSGVNTGNTFSYTNYVYKIV